MSNRCFIVGAGEFDGFEIKPSAKDLVIAADGGYQALLDTGRKPDVLIGDLDSIKLQDLPTGGQVFPQDLKLIRHSPVKDDTDMALAAEYAVKKGCRQLFLYGGMGGRLDHTIANLQLLTSLSKEGLEAYLIGQGICITAVTDGSVAFSEKAEGILSVFCFGKPAKGVTEHGLKYTIRDAVLTSERALGVSNEFIGCRSRVEVKNGTLLLIWDCMNGLPERGTFS